MKEIKYKDVKKCIRDENLEKTVASQEFVKKRAPDLEGILHNETRNANYFWPNLSLSRNNRRGIR